MTPVVTGPGPGPGIFRPHRLVAAGRLDRAALAEAHTKEQELEAIHRALYWAKVTGGAVHIVHVSIADRVRAVAQARLDGVRATAETCAHYLFFEEQDHLRRGPDVRCFPPIRDRDEVEALWGCVADGTLDMVTSDHSPFLPADRAAGQDNVWLGQPEPSWPSRAGTGSRHRR